MTKHTIAIKRVYDEPAQNDGTRVLVDRLWPRGIKKEQAYVDLWLKEVAPGNELRKWFNHDPTRFSEFRHRYKAELQSDICQQALTTLRDLAKQNTLTLLFSAKDTEHNNAIVLRELLTEEQHHSKE